MKVVLAAESSSLPLNRKVSPVNPEPVRDGRAAKWILLLMLLAMLVARATLM